MADYGFRGGEKLVNKLTEIEKTTDGRPELRVGFIDARTEANGRPVAAVAAWNEFGTQHIPPRPFFRNMIAARGPNWGHDMARIIGAVGYHPMRVLMLMGERIEGQLKQSIFDTNSPPLAPSTIARKSLGGVSNLAGVLGPAKPLIHTGTMFNSINYEVSANGQTEKGSP